MELDEIKSYLAAGQSHSIRIDVSLSGAFPGFVRTITIHEGNKVNIEFEAHGMDEGGAYYWAEYPTLEAAIASLEGYLGKPHAHWENYSRSGFYPVKPDGLDMAESHDLLAKAISVNSPSLPTAEFQLKSDYWIRFKSDPHKRPDPPK
jgi:hypothetical protein